MRLVDVVSMVGVALTLTGLVIAIWEARRARIASISAKLAAEMAWEASIRSSAIVDLSNIIKALSKLKTLHRMAVLEVLPARYEALRLSVISLKQANLFNNHQTQKSMQSLIAKLAGIERTLDCGVSADTFLAGVPRLNSQITKAIEQLQILLVSSARKE